MFAITALLLCASADAAPDPEGGIRARIARVAAACAVEPMRSGGTVYYYCDCGTGASAGCHPGDDGNAGTDPDHPRRTIASAASLLRSHAAVNDTVALCRGGAFDATGSLQVGSTRCGAGVVCNDLRDYAPTTFAGVAKPVINNAAGNVSLFSITGNLGGVRIMNLRLVGDNGAMGNHNMGFFIYSSAHDVTACNLEMDLFDFAFYNESNNGVTQNIKLTGSRITNSRTMGYLGAGDHNEISYNEWEGNGSTNMFDHTVYLGTHDPVVDVRLVGNAIHGQYGPTCLGAPVVVHGQFDGLLIDGNLVDVDHDKTTGGCWGMGLGAGGYSEPAWFRHVRIANNVIRNGGNTPLTVANCPGCLIENNLILQDWTYGPSTGVGGWSVVGIGVPSDPARSAQGDDINDANVIRNNTIWFGPRSTGATGIRLTTEGSGHVVANNVVVDASLTPGQPIYCYDYGLALTAYAFINNNLCYSLLNSSWEKSRGSLAAWRTYAVARSFDTASLVADPKYALDQGFIPPAASPLVGAGSAAQGSMSDLFGRGRAAPPAIGAFEPGWPDSPQLTGMAAGRERMRLSFTPPTMTGGLPITGYTASCTGGGTTITRSGSTSPVIVTGLLANTSYQCSVHADNDWGGSAESASLTRIARWPLVPPWSLLLVDYSKQ